MLTVIPLAFWICSFRTTYPTPGRLIRVLGATSSATLTPPTLRPSNDDPFASLTVLPPTLVADATPNTRDAEMSPFRMLTSATVAMLCAPALPAPVAPVVMLDRNSDENAPGTLNASPEASTICPSAWPSDGRTAIGVLLCEATGVWTYAP